MNEYFNDYSDIFPPCYKVIQNINIGNWNKAQSEFYVTLDIFNIKLDICRQQIMHIICNDTYP